MVIKTEESLRKLKAIGRIVGLTIQHMSQQLRPGMTTAELDAIGALFLKQHGARSAPILAYDFPGHTCISINDEAAHGIPGDRVIQPGDLVNIDVSAEMDGYWADSGRSFGVPPVRPEHAQLLQCIEEALDVALKAARAGQKINRVGKAVEAYAKQAGYRTIRELGGHGVGGHIHEKPTVLNYYVSHNRERFRDGQVVAIEPFLTPGAGRIETMSDGWTLRTRDRSVAAQCEHTVVITKGEPILITAV